MKPVCDTQDLCPLLRKRRNKVCHTCAWYTHFAGTHPQTGEVINQWECAITMLPVLMIETSKQMFGATVAVQELRNEVKENADRTLKSDFLRLGTLLQAVKK
jgi:hypothetical protein